MKQEYMKVSSILIVVLGVFFWGCETCGRNNERIGHIDALIQYLQNHNIDSAIFQQKFFTDSLRSRQGSFPVYLSELEALQRRLKSTQPLIQIQNMDDEFRETTDCSSPIFAVIIASGQKRDSVYFLLTDKGVDSFTPFIKGRRIVSWFY